MQTDHAQRRIMGLFADMLDYPTPDLPGKAAECLALVGDATPGAAGLLGSFCAFVEETPLTRLEEIYSGFFDLNPICFPYVGYQLFGENYKRSSFLVRLKEWYRAEAFDTGDSREIADRLSLVLRFVSRSKGGEDVFDLVHEILKPAIQRMISKPECSDHDHAGEHAEFDGDTGVERKQLDGHSQGEVLAGGFVLQLSAEEEGDPRGGSERPHPYHQVLEALSVVLRDAWQTQEVPS